MYQKFADGKIILRKGDGNGHFGRVDQVEQDRVEFEESVAIVRFACLLGIENFRELISEQRLRIVDPTNKGGELPFVRMQLANFEFVDYRRASVIGMRQYHSQPTEKNRMNFIRSLNRWAGFEVLKRSKPVQGLSNLYIRLTDQTAIDLKKDPNAKPKHFFSVYTTVGTIGRDDSYWSRVHMTASGKRMILALTNESHTITVKGTDDLVYIGPYGMSAQDYEAYKSQKSDAAASKPTMTSASVIPFPSASAAPAN